MPSRSISTLSTLGFSADSAEDLPPGWSEGFGVSGFGGCSSSAGWKWDCGLSGARPEHLVRLTWYVVDIEEYRTSLPALGAAYRDVLGRWYPAMTLVQVAALVEREARLEIEATAIIGTNPARPRASPCQLRSAVSPVPKCEGPGAPSS